VSRHDWLLLIHVAGAFSVLAGALLAVVLNQAAMRRSRPSEVALLLGLTRVAVVLISVGMVVALAVGLWLVDDTAYDLGDAWIGAALVLWQSRSSLDPSGDAATDGRGSSPRSWWPQATARATSWQHDSATRSRSRSATEAG